MKKKVFLALLILVFCFTGGGIYIAHSTEKVISKLEIITTLHQVEFFRKDLQNKIKVVQTDLLLKDSPHALQVDPFIAHVEEMDKAARLCTSCHHVPVVKRRLDNLQQDIDNYMKKLSRVYTIRANKERLAREREAAFNLGEEVMSEVENIAITSSEKIANRISQIRNSINNTQRLLFFLITGGPVLLILITYFFLNNVTSSIASLIRATRTLKEGNMQARVSDKLSDEFQELATAFNEMAASLKQQCLYLQHAERLAVVGELAAGLAHEVKNPLAGIKVSIEVLANDLPLEQEDKEVFLRVINEIHRIESLLKGLLSYARPPEPTPEVIDLHHMLETTIKNVQFPLTTPASNGPPEKKIDFVRDFSPERLQISADPDQLQQVILNLLLNAIDAISVQGTITVKTRPESNRAVQITISDTGRGMSRENAAKIFNPFFTTKPKGTGLGLAICKRLIELHGGTIHVSSTPEKGTTFYITLPENHQNWNGDQ